MSRRSALAFVAAATLCTSCDQLGNPPQFATGPTPWRDDYGDLVTTTRSFNNESTVRRLVSEGMDHLDYADPAIGPSQTLTIVVVVPRALRPPRGRRIRLVTVFKIEGRSPVARNWTVAASSEKWTAAFALPEPPDAAVTSVAP